MAVLNDRLLAHYGAAGMVSPYDPLYVNPASIDLRVGSLIRRPHPVWYKMTRQDMLAAIADGSIRTLPKWGPDEHFETTWLMPGEFVLCHSLELTRIPDDMIAVLFSKSSTGRIGLEHLHAGFGDCGFGDNEDGGASWTWELINVAPWPIELVAGKRLMQIVLIRMAEPALRTYAETGRYNNQAGPTPAKE